MTTKPRTKKPAAKPKRYIRVAVRAGKATLQESDQPNRGFKPQRQPKPTAEDIGRSIGDALGRRLESLLAKPENPGFDAVSAWTVEKLGDGDGVTGFTCAKYATETVPTRISPVEEALRRLRDEISMAELSTDMSTERLDSILGPPAPTAGGTDVAAPIRMSGELAGLLNGLADRLSRDNARRTHLLDRLEL